METRNSYWLFFPTCSVQQKEIETKYGVHVIDKTFTFIISHKNGGDFTKLQQPV